MVALEWCPGEIGLRYILRIEVTGFADGLDIGGKRGWWGEGKEGDNMIPRLLISVSG